MPDLALAKAAHFHGAPLQWRLEAQEPEQAAPEPRADSAIAEDCAKAWAVKSQRDRRRVYERHGSDAVDVTVAAIGA